MREALFIKKNKDRWENIKDFPSTNPDEMAVEFTQLTDDLGYAKTFYPHSKVTRYLNAEAAKRYISIYANRKEERNRIVTFFKYDVPVTVAKHQWVLLFCFTVFAIFFSVGFFSAMHDESFVVDMLGSSYVQKTEQNIANGNPFGIYQTGNSFLVWMGIMVNNITVVFSYFFEGGVSAGILSTKSLIVEGIRLGAFEFMFYKHGLTQMSVLTVLLHGILELSAIIIGAAAAIVLGKSWIFPGTIKRITALKQGAKDGIKILIALVPVLIVAAFFESFVTRHYKMPVALSLSILSTSMSFIVWYFIIYPIKLKKRIKHTGTWLK